MMKRNRIFLMFLILELGYLRSATQSINLDLKMGYATGTMKLLKKNMLYEETTLGYETKPSINFAQRFSLGISKVKFDYYDTSFNQVYSEKTFLTLPIEFRKYQGPQNAGNKTFWQVGLTGNLLLKDKNEIRNVTGLTKQTKDFTGFNLGLNIGAGLRTRIGGGSALVFAFSVQKDIFTSYKNEFDKIKFQKLQLGVGFSFGVRNKSTKPGTL